MKAQQRCAIRVFELAQIAQRRAKNPGAQFPPDPLGIELRTPRKFEFAYARICAGLVWGNSTAPFAIAHSP